MSKAKHTSAKSRTAKSSPHSLSNGASDASDLPTFQQSYLKWFRVCSCFPLDGSPLSEQIAKQKTITKLETRFESNAGPTWIRLRTSQKHDSEDAKSLKGSFLVECQLESWFPPSQTKRTPPNTTEEVCEYLRLCLQQKVAFTCCEGLFLIPQNKIPKRGFVGLMLEISAGVGKAEMNLTGATFDIQGRAPYEQLNWRRRTISGKGKTEQREIEVTIAAEPSTDESCNCLEDAAIMLSKGVQEFVVESEGLR